MNKILIIIFSVLIISCKAGNGLKEEIENIRKELKRIDRKIEHIEKKVDSLDLRLSNFRKEMEERLIRLKRNYKNKKETFSHPWYESCGRCH